MHKKIVFTFLVLQCTLCLTIRVPVDWNDDSEVKDGQFAAPKDEIQTSQSPIYNEYFQYTANKPQFAIDIAATHGVQSPENHYKSYPIKPHTGLTKPILGQHQILNSERNTYQSYQPFLQNSGHSNYVTPVSTSFEVYHPYKNEEPALKEIYKDPVLDQIRNDLRNSKNRLQKYENEAGKVDISDDEYLESPKRIEQNKNPQKNIPSQFEVHRPQRRPIYYRLPFRQIHHREQILNHKLRHPWNQNIAKVTPNHYRPVKNHLYRLRQQHALKYDDEHNEYPQLPISESYDAQPDGYDIYEKNKAKYVHLRNNLDESINKVVQQNRPDTHNKLELQNGYTNNDSNNNQDEDQFVPIKNYAQVRKTETTKHLPRKAALHDAETIEEIQNAPRLREAIKSTKAQIVYSEEGYEDAAYDHAGEQKHASDHERHGGYLKENEISGGKYKIPSISASYEDNKGSVYRDQLLHGEKWKDNKKEKQDEKESNDYSEENDEDDLSSVIIENLNIENETDRNKRNSDIFDEPDSNENDLKKYNKENVINLSKNTSQHEMIKRETSFKIPEFDFNSTLPSDVDIFKLSKTKVTPQKLKTDIAINTKYPYYFKNINTLSKNSPLRYAENINLIPKKSNGGTEFYDSRSEHECSEVEDNVDAIPEKLNKDGNPDDNDNSNRNTDVDRTNENKFDSLKDKQRLKGLGDKIDCFKVKYFGENPLDSPFFNEEIISNPEPITKPHLKVFETKKLIDRSNSKIFYDDIFSVIGKPQNKSNQFFFPLQNEPKVTTDITLKNNSLLSNQSNHYPNLLNLTNNSFEGNRKLLENIENSNLSNGSSNLTNLMYKHFKNKEDVTKSPLILRKKRATPFLYEPYKIIRDSQVQDSKKTTTSSNISPLIKQLQSSRVIDKVTTNIDLDQSKKNFKAYKDIGKNDRQKSLNVHIIDTKNSSFVDISSGKRRGEPHYELRPTNHKTTYSPVEKKRAVSFEDYKTKISNNGTEINTKQLHSASQAQPKRSISSKMISKPYFDVSKYLPEVLESQNIAASNTIRKVIRTTTPEVNTDQIQEQKYETDDDDSEEYDEYEDDDDDNGDEEEINIKTTTTTTTTTRKPTTRKRTRGTTTIKPISIEKETEPPKLHLITRFRNSPTTMKSTTHQDVVHEPIQKVDSYTPKYTEKKRKSTKSTLITDTKTYGEDDDGMTRKEVDALLRVKQDMDEYMPHYEKENNNGNIKKGYDSNESDDDVSNNNENESDEEDDEDDEEDSDDDDFDEDEGTNENKGSDDSNNQKNLELTTSEPTKRTLVRTTVAPATTTESRSAKIELKPRVLKKKLEIHEELPINRSTPHITQFKHDVKEIEIIKEMTPNPKKRTHKNLEALDLYRDDNLAEEINKLGDVEVFRENLNLKSDPKHGGNYRSLTSEDLQKEIVTTKIRDSANKGDVETSPTQPRKRIKLNDDRTSRRPINFASRISQSSANNDARNTKNTEIDDTVLKTSKNKNTRNNDKSAKLIELDEDDEDGTLRMHGGNFKSYENRNAGRQMHGGNYKSAKIVESDDPINTKPRSRSKIRDARTNAAALLNSYVRAAPILTTTPAFILDPSKRMYYYVDS